MPRPTRPAPRSQPAQPPASDGDSEVVLPEDLALADAPAAEPGKPATALSARKPSAGKAASRSARGKAASAPQPAASSRRAKVVDPEARRAAQKTILWIAVSMLVAAIVITAIILLTTHRSDDKRLGREAIQEAIRQADAARNAITHKQGEEAKLAYDKAMRLLLDTPQLGGAVSMPPEVEPVVRELAIQAFNLRTEIEPLSTSVVAVQDENAADKNFANLRSRMNRLSDQATDLDQLETDILAFIENPVDPKGAPSAVHAATFARLVGEAKLHIARIASEREVRKADATTTPVRLTAAEIDGMILEERFGDALARIGAAAEKHPKADFGPLRNQLAQAAESAWKSAKSQIDTRLADWRAEGTGTAQRQAALEAAKVRLNQIIERFGMAEYTDQARAILSGLP